MKKDEITQRKTTPLIDAVIDEDVKVIQILLKTNDPSEEDKNGETPLFFAASQNNITIVELLLSKGAQVDKKNLHGNSPLNRAVFAYEGDGSVIKALLAAGADANLSNAYGVTPRSLAKDIANYDVAKYFS